MTLGEKIRKTRKAKGLSQETVAAALGVSRQAVRDVIERAKVQLAELEVKLGFAKKIAETLEICKRLRTSYRERDDAAALAETLEAVWEKKNGIVFGTQ